MIARYTFAALYATSAAAALALELLWTRSLALSLGARTAATAAVLAAFLAGLAAGAALGERLGQRAGRVRWRFALVQWLGAALAPLPLVAPGWWAAPLVLLSAIPLGMVFPLAARLRERDGSGRGPALAGLAALDAAGAMVGCLSTGLLVLPALGIRRALTVAIGVKLAVGLLALGCRERQQQATANCPFVRPGPEGLLAFVCGLALIGSEALWARLLAFALTHGSTTYTLTALLTIVLAGNAAGAVWVGRRRSFPDEQGELARAGAWALATGAGLLTSLGLLLVAGPNPSPAPLGLLDALTALLACGPAAFCSGATFACACRAASARGGAGGAVLAANASGGLVGALAVPGALSLGLGLGGTLALLSLAPPAAALLVRPTRRRLCLALCLTAAALGLLSAGPRWLRHLGGTLVFHREGVEASVAVVEDPPGVRRLYVDGIAVAGTDLALAIDQKMLAHLPLLLHPEARAVVTIGFGAGGTSHSLLLHPGTEIEAIEIAPEVLAAAPALREANGGLPQRAEPRFRLHLADARRWLRLAERRFDVITVDCTDLAYRSDAALYTADFFRLAASRLRPGGLVAAWLPLRGQPPWRVLRSVVGGFADAFPRVSLWVFDAFPVHFGILIGAETERGIDPTRPLPAAVCADLAAMGLSDPARLAVARAADDRTLRRLAAGAPRHTDDRPVVEFAAPLESGGDQTAYDALAAIGPSPPPPVAGDEPHRTRAAARWRLRPWLLSGHRAFAAGDEEEARRRYLLAARLASGDDDAPWLLLGDTPERRASLEDHAAAGDDAAALALSGLELQRGRPRRALARLEPTDLATRTTAGRLLVALARLQLGQWDPGRVALLELLSVRPDPAVAARASMAGALAGLPSPLREVAFVLTTADR